MKSKLINYVFRHKETNKYLEVLNLGDGEIGLNLIDYISPDCVLNNNNWSLAEIIEIGGDGGEANNVFINFTDKDFDKLEVEIILK